MTCGAVHPERPLACGLEGNHALHAAFGDGDWVSWPNPDFVPPRPRSTRTGWTERMNDIASRADRDRVAEDPRASAVALQREPRDTSRDAAFAALPNSGTARWRVLMCIRDSGEAGATDEEIRTRLDMRYSTECARRQELERGDWIMDSGRRRPTSTGNDAIVWVVSAEGRDKLRAF